MTELIPPARRPLVLGICLALPLLILGYSWITSDQDSRRGTFWDVPVAGYDPRDLLRGHYINFEYLWPVKGNKDDTYGTSLCLKGQAPEIKYADAVAATSSAQLHCPKGAWISNASRMDDNGLDTGRLYVPQTKAADYERRIANPVTRAIMRVRIDYNGVVHPVSLSFRPKTVEELAKDRENDREADGSATPSQE